MWFLQTLPSHVSCAVTIIQESMCLWHVPLNTRKLLPKYTEALYRTPISAMGLLVNSSVATPEQLRERHRGALEERFWILSPCYSHGLKTIALHTLPVPPRCKEENAASKASSCRSIVYFKTCRNTVVTTKTVAFAKRFFTKWYLRDHNFDYF